jgi:UDP-N-acetylglucosamine--dolichyl-phosphate N-acetylglucosaminephosphotransferase
MGGLAILGGIMISLVLTQLLYNLIPPYMNLTPFFVYYFVVLVFGLYGLTDDLFSFKKRYDKILILYFLALPIAILTRDTTLNLLFMQVNLGVLYAFLFAPIYVMAVANLVNVHAGFNGLISGLSMILLVTAAIGSYFSNGLNYIPIIIPVLGALAAFIFYNEYPAQVLLGNVGAYLLGGALGAFLIVSNQELFGVVILIPHIFNIIIDTYTLKIRKVPLVKFGGIREDGTIESPPVMKYVSLKFLVTHYFRLTEPQAVLILCGITLVFCIIGLFLAPYI